MKSVVYQTVDEVAKELYDLSDWIFDHPEFQNEEYEASKKLADYLATHGFKIEFGLGSLDTAFRAVFQKGGGGPSFGLLCEYDALRDMGHGCGHHMQGPTIVAAAVALSRVDGNFKIVVYGTPAEEGGRGKRVMAEEGCFKDIDIALAVHGGDFSRTNSRARAVHRYDVHFHGMQSHSAGAPEKGRSAVDAVQLTNIGVEFMREHVPEDVRIHYAMYDMPLNPNIVPKEASVQYLIRSLDQYTVEDVCERFKKIVQGAAMMTETEYEIVDGNGLKSTLPNKTLDELGYKNLVQAGAVSLSTVEKHTGSTDFGDVSQILPSTLLYLSMMPEGNSAHTQAMLDYGKRPECHNAINFGAKALAGMCVDMLSDPKIINKAKSEFINKTERKGRK